VTEDQELSHTRRGVGSPLLLIQGLSATRLYWGSKFLAELEQRFDVLAYDHRGVAGSSRRESGFTMRDLARDAAELIEAQGWPSAGVFGVSMGGMVAQELAMLRPDLVQYLVLGCTRANGGSFGRPGDAITERLIASYVHGDEAATQRNMFMLSFSRDYTERAEAWPTFLEMNRYKVDPATSVRQISAIRDFDVREKLKHLDIPVMVMHGDADEMVPYEEGVEVGRRIGKARFEAIGGAGHFFWVERPWWTAEVLKSFAMSEMPESSAR
jgi:3-oxoadipate enol-lactonase